MRIIAGLYRHRLLVGPDENDLTTRPMLDRVKQALFDRLWAADLFPIPNDAGEITPQGNTLDLFSGIGQLGLESLSRGAAHCTFIEKSRQHTLALQQNIQNLNLTTQTTILSTDILRPTWLPLLSQRPLRLIFCDPPYPLMQDHESSSSLLSILSQLPQTPNLLEPNAFLILRTPKQVPPPPIPHWTTPVSHSYGQMTLSFYHPSL